MLLPALLYISALTFRTSKNMDKRADFFGTAEHCVTPSRVKPVWRMPPGVAACGLTPGYILATLQVAKNRRLGRCGKQIARFVKHVRPRSGKSNEASRHRHAAQTSARSKFARRLVGLRRSFVRQVLSHSRAPFGDSTAGLDRTRRRQRSCP